jgi:hypothetical protein
VQSPLVPEILLLSDKYIFDRSAAIRRISTRTKVVGVNHEQQIEAAKTACNTNQAIQLAGPWARGHPTSAEEFENRLLGPTINFPPAFQGLADIPILHY